MFLFAMLYFYSCWFMLKVKRTFHFQLADMVNLHFLNTVEALMECDSAVVSRVSVWKVSSK